MKQLFLFFLAALTSVSASAQKGRKGPKEHKSPEAVAAKRADHLKSELGLSDEQRTRVYNAVMTRNAKFRAIKQRYKDSSNRKGMGSELKVVREAFQAEMNGILTPEQKVKYDAMKKKGKDKRDDDDEDDDDDSSGKSGKGNSSKNK